MKVKINKDILKCVPSFDILAFKFNIEIKESDNKILDKINEEIQKYLNMPMENIIKLPNISDARYGYKAFGKDPSRYRLACESLLRRISKGMGLYYINNAVDIGNLLSILLQRSIAVLDYDKIDGDVIVRLGTENDEYYGIGRGLLNVCNIPLYCDNISPFGSPTSDTLRTSITNDTKTILLFVIMFSDLEREYCEKITKDLFSELANVKTFEKIMVIKEGEE